MVADSQEQWTIGRLIDWTKAYLDRHDVDQPRLATEVLLAHALGCKKIELYTRYDAVPQQAQLQSFRESIRQASTHYPIAYLVGRKEFYSLDFDVSPDVLIPRPETELLVDQVIAYARADEQRALTILDFGTGSGCIGLTLAKFISHASVIGTDISARAVDVATSNAEKLGLSDRFEVRQCDGFDDSLPTCDIVVSNPPYVAVDDPNLHRDVYDHEPHEALFAGKDGLNFYRLIADRAPSVLTSQGTVFVEIGYDQHDAVIDIFNDAQDYAHTASWRDQNEGHWRVLRFDRTC